MSGERGNFSGRGFRGGRGGANRGRGNLAQSAPVQGGGNWSASGSVNRNLRKSGFQAGKSRLSSIFHEFDEDNSGFISAVELRMALKRKFDVDLDHDNTMLLLQHGDENTDGELSEEEFLKILELTTTMKRQFDAADADNSKSIDNEELFNLMESRNIILPAQQVDELIKVFDDDNSGVIEFQEYFNMILYVQELEYQYEKRLKQGRNSSNENTDFTWLQSLLGQTAADPELISSLRNIKNMSFSTFMEEIIKALARNKSRERAPRAKVVRPQRKKAPKRVIASRKVERTSKILQSRATLKGTYTRLEPFVDTDFPPDRRSLGHLASKVTSWKRPIDISPKARLFVDGVEEGDVVQGALGDCWFLGALSLLACSGNEFIDEIFVSSRLDSGRHVLKFFKNGGWHEVEVDDLIPCGPDGKPAFARCKDENEFWVPIVEKAYAKLHGGYHNLTAGQMGYALKDLTGEPVESLHLDSPETLPCGSIDEDSIWNLFIENIAESHIMGCLIDSPAAMAEEKNSYDLLLNHAYGIIDCQEIQGNRLLRIRNPWGSIEWNGPWSDGAPEWTPELQAHFGNYEFDNDGTFFMCLSDFLRFFNVVNVLRMLTDDVGEVWEKHSFDGVWDSDESSGGCLAFPSWKKNPQFRIRTEPNTKVFVCLSQEDKRYQLGRRAKLESMGLTILKGDNRTKINKKKAQCTQSDIVKTSVFYSSRDVSLEFTMLTDESIIVPSFYKPNIASNFSLLIYLQSPGSVKQLYDTVEVTYDSGSNKKVAGWSTETSGGCMNHPTWISNPQYILRCTEPCDCIISITQELQPLQPPVTMGAYIFDANYMKGYRLGDQNQKFAAKISFINLETITATLTIKEPSIPFMIMPCTFDPKVVRGYTIDVTTTAGSGTLHEAKYWSDDTLAGEWRQGCAGGSMNSRSWQSNPTFRMTISGAGPCTVSVALFVPRLVESSIGFYLFEDVKGNGVPVVQGLRGNCPFKGTYSNIFEFTDLPGKQYIIMPCTVKPKNYSPFYITALNPRCKLEGPFV